jgi:diacylglycerol kinase family enzyme
MAQESRNGERFVDSRSAVDIVVNCNARHLRAEGALRALLLRAAERFGAHVHETRSIEELDAVARRIAQRTTGAVVFAGGDGSHMAGISALAHACPDALPPVALAPGGTVCTVARNLGMRGDALTWTERLLGAVCEGRAHAVTRPTLRVRDDGGGDRVGFIFGAGLVARFFDAYYAAPQQGLAAAGVLAARVFAGSLVGSPSAQSLLATTACELTVDGVPAAARDWSLVLASVVRDVGLHIRATYRGGERADRFHLVASGLSPRQLSMQVPRVLAGRPMRGEPHLDTLARSLRVAFPVASAYVLDGDLLRARSVGIEVGPTIEVLLPGVPNP